MLGQVHVQYNLSSYKIWTQTQRENSHVTTKAQMTVHADTSQGKTRIANNHQRLGRGKEGPSSRTFGEITALLIPWVWTAGLQNGKIQCLLLEATQVVEFVMAALGN